MQVKPSLAFGGDSSVAMSLLLDKGRPGPEWIDLDAQTCFLCDADKAVLCELTSTYDGDSMTDVDEAQARHQWDQFPVKLYPFISQSSSAWLALRKYHAITASVAFDLLLCGTGPSRERYGRAGKPLKISSYRKSACANSAVPRSV